jgi:hypothetical protein
MKEELAITLALVASCLVGRCALAQEAPAEATADCAALQEDLFADLKQVVKAGCTPSQAQIAKLLDNPVGNFAMISIQYDAVQIEGARVDRTETLHRLQAVPMFPLSLGEDWNLVNRVVFPALSVPINEGFGDCIGYGPGSISSCPSFPDALADPFKPTRGFGDMLYVALASPKEVIRIQPTGGAVIWGVGATTMFPTASDEVLGTGKYAAGPAGVVGYLGKKWELGLFAQHWWSVAGDDARADVNLTNLQYFLYYVPPWDDEAQWRIGMCPNISYNWEAWGDKATVPIGLGVARMFEIGQLPVNVLVEADYSAIHPDDTPGSRWDFRVYFVPVIPTFMF